MASRHEFGGSAAPSETEDNSWDSAEVQAAREPVEATNAEKQNSRLSAKSLFEKGTVNGNESEDLSNAALGIRAQRMELGAGSSVTQVEHTGGPRAGTSETRLAITGEDGESQEITFSQSPDGETKVTLGGQEVTDQDTLDQINAVTGHLHDQMDGDSESSTSDSAAASHEQSAPEATEQPVAQQGAAQNQDGFIVNRASAMNNLRVRQAELRASQTGTPSWQRAQQERPTTNLGDVSGNMSSLQEVMRQRRENADASYAAWQEQQFSSDVEAYVQSQSAKNLQEKVAEQINEDSEGRVDLEAIDTNEVADRIAERSSEAVREAGEVDPSDDNIEEIVEDAAESVEGEHIAEKSREDRVEDARSEIAALFGEESGENGDALEAAEYKINEETSGAEKGAESDAVQEVAEESKQAQEQGGEGDAEQQKKQRLAKFNNAFGAVVNSPVGNILKQFGVDPRKVGESIKSGDVEITDDMMSILTDIAKNRGSAIWGEKPNEQTPLGRAAKEQQTKVQRLAEQLGFSAE